MLGKADYLKENIIQRNFRYLRQEKEHKMDIRCFRLYHLFFFF